MTIIPYMFHSTFFESHGQLTPLYEKFEDTKGITRSRKFVEGQRIQWPKVKGQKDKQWSTKRYTENYRSSNGESHLKLQIEQRWIPLKNTDRATVNPT